MSDLAAQLAAKFNTTVPDDTAPSGPSTAPADPGLARLAGLVEDVTGVPADRVDRGSRLRADLGVDSLSLVELSVRAEEEFGVRLDSRTVADFATVGDALAVLENRRD